MVGRPFLQAVKSTLPDSNEPHGPAGGLTCGADRTPGWHLPPQRWRKEPGDVRARGDVPHLRGRARGARRALTSELSLPLFAAQLDTSGTEALLVLRVNPAEMSTVREEIRVASGTIVYEHWAGAQRVA